MSEIKKNALGRGLSSLLSPKTEENKESIFSLSVDAIEKGAFQPRKHFPEEEIRELAASIQQRGVLQPILVRVLSAAEGKYELIAGERRWRATKLAGLDKIPAIVRYFSDKEVLEIGLLENIQRQDLNPMEEAEGYQRLSQEFNHTQETLSRILGKSRSHIANTLRLLSLPKTVQEHLITGKLSPGHGRALIGMENPEEIADMIISRRLNVRQAEALSKQKDSASPAPMPPSEADKNILQTQLSDLLGCSVKVLLKGNSGEISIPFKNPTELEKLMNKFSTLKKSVEPTARKIWN